MVKPVASRNGNAVAADHVEAVMRAARALVGITAASITEVDEVVTMPQLRVLMMIATRGPMNLAGVAAGLEVSAPNASRICDRLLKAGMLDRRDDPKDRRHITLTLTTDGHALIDRVIRHRRMAIKRILRNMSPQERGRLATSLDRFADAVGEPAADAPFALI
jgi:DNA-binding MarR family transcriptional regulator